MQYAQSSGQPCTWLSDSPDLRYSTTSRARAGNASICSLVSNGTNVVTAPPTDVVAGGVGAANTDDVPQRGLLVLLGMAGSGTSRAPLQLEGRGDKPDKTSSAGNGLVVEQIRVMDGRSPVFAGYVARRVRAWPRRPRPGFGAQIRRSVWCPGRSCGSSRPCCSGERSPWST